MPAFPAGGDLALPTASYTLTTHLMRRIFVWSGLTLALSAVACQRGAEHHMAAPAVDDAPDPEACSPPLTFADGKNPERVRHVSVAGSDQTGDGSAAKPFRTIARAAQEISAGTAIYVHAGTYAGRTLLTGLTGTDAAPIWIKGAPGEARPTINGGFEGIHLVKPRYVVLTDLEISNTADSGINIDDGDDTANPEAARFVVLRDLDVHDAGTRPSGIASCVKLSGVNDVSVLRSTFARCGSGPGSGSVGVDGVGVHRAVVAFNRFASTGFGGVQVKGGSSDIEVRSNLFLDTGWRAVNMGGSTGEPFFRPPLDGSRPNYEAARVRVVANIFSGGETAAAFVGCVDCQFSHNTVVNPSKWLLRILQESVTNDRYSFAASRGTIAGNIFYFRRSDLNAGEDINIGEGAESKGFSLARNLWYAHDDPPASRPRLPRFDGFEEGSLIGIDPGFVDVAAGNLQLNPRSAARAAGSAKDVSGADFAAHCYATPPSLGALQ